MIDLKLLTIVLSSFVYLYITPVNYDETVIKVEDVYFNITRTVLFDFVTNPDIFSKWFSWVSKVHFADHKLLGIGKKYYAYFTKTPIIFQIKNLKIDDRESSVVLVADTVLKPIFKIKIIETNHQSKNPRLKFIVSIIYNRKSLLFKYAIGNILRQITLMRMKDSCINLRKILNKFEIIDIHNVF